MDCELILLSIIKGKRRKKKKLKAPYSGMTMSEMIQAREIEKQRINEVVNDLFERM